MKADNKTELLSPAGSWDALVAAVQTAQTRSILAVRRFQRVQARTI